VCVSVCVCACVVCWCVCVCVCVCVSVFFFIYLLACSKLHSNIILHASQLNIHNTATYIYTYVQFLPFSLVTTVHFLFSNLLPIAFLSCIFRIVN